MLGTFSPVDNKYTQPSSTSKTDGIYSMEVEVYVFFSLHFVNKSPGRKQIITLNPLLW